MISALLDNIQANLEALTQGLGDLRRQIESDPNLTISELRWIPYRTNDQADLPELVVPELVNPADAVEVVASSVTSIYYREDQHAKSTIRVAGLVGVSPSVIEALAEVNRLKKAFKDSVTEVPIRQRRQLIKHLPGLSRLQAYRELVSISRHPDEVHFFWAANKVGVARRTVAVMLEELKVEKDATPSTDIDLLRAIEMDIEKLAGMDPREIIARARPIRLHPQCNVWIGGSLAGQEDAYLPVFYPVDPAQRAPKVRALGESSKGERQRAIRSDRKLDDEPLLERLDVYRYRVNFRSYEEASQ